MEAERFDSGWEALNAAETSCPRLLFVKTERRMRGLAEEDMDEGISEFFLQSETLCSEANCDRR